MTEEPREDAGYEVKDKRRVNSDGTLREDAEPQAKAEQPGAQAEQGETPPPNVYALLEFMGTMLAETAWQLLGLRLAPGQKEIIKDLPQAKIAIDTIAFIAEKIDSQITQDDRVALRGMISDLQLNYVRQTQG